MTSDTINCYSTLCKQSVPIIRPSLFHFPVCNSCLCVPSCLHFFARPFVGALTAPGSALTPAHDLDYAPSPQFKCRSGVSKDCPGRGGSRTPSLSAGAIKLTNGKARSSPTYYTTPFLLHRSHLKGARCVQIIPRQTTPPVLEYDLNTSD